MKDKKHIMKDETVTVLFFDDEKYFAARYIESLEESGIKVHFVEQVDDVISTLEQYPEINALILDVMAPPPQGLPLGEANEGLDTGLWVMRTVRNYILEGPRPVLILTNRNIPYIEECVSRSNLPSCLITIRSKMNTPAFFLPKHLTDFLERARRDYKP